MPFDYEAERIKTQRKLVEFIKAELKLVPALVQSAALDKSAGHLDHYAAAKENALKAAQTSSPHHSTVDHPHHRDVGR